MGDKDLAMAVPLNPDLDRGSGNHRRHLKLDQEVEDSLDHHRRKLDLAILVLEVAAHRRFHAGRLGGGSRQHGSELVADRSKVR